MRVQHCCVHVSSIHLSERINGSKEMEENGQIKELHVLLITAFVHFVTLALRRAYIPMESMSHTIILTNVN